MSNTYKHAQAFYQAIASSADSDKAFDALHLYISAIGFPKIYYAVVRNPVDAATASAENRIEFVRDDDGWWEEYEAARYYRYDPYTDLASLRIGFPTIIKAPNKMSKGQQQFVAHARQRGMMNGFSYLFPVEFNRPAGISIRGGQALPTQAQMIEICSAFSTWNSFYLRRLAAATREELSLSDLEIRRLDALMFGYSARNLASLEDTTESAINHSFLRIRKKLGARTNVEMIRKAIQLGIVELSKSGHN